MLLVLLLNGCSKPVEKLYGEWIAVETSYKYEFRTDNSWQMTDKDIILQSGKYTADGNQLTVYDAQGKEFIKGNFSILDASLLISDVIKNLPAEFIHLPKDKYYKVYRFKDRMLKVEKDVKFGFVDAKGNEVIPVKYNDASDFTGGYAIVREGNTFTVINKQGASEVTLDTRSAVFLPYPETDADSVVALVLTGKIPARGKVVWNGYNNKTDKEIREYIVHGDSVAGSKDSLLLSSVVIDTTYNHGKYNRRMIVLATTLNSAKPQVPFYSAYVIIPFNGMMILEAADNYINELGTPEKPASVFALAPGDFKTGVYFIAGVNNPNYKKTDGYLYPFYDGEFTEALRVPLYFDGGGDKNDTTMQRYQAAWNFLKQSGVEYYPVLVTGKGRAFNPTERRVMPVEPETQYKFSAGNYIKDNR